MWLFFLMTLGTVEILTSLVNKYMQNTVLNWKFKRM